MTRERDRDHLLVHSPKGCNNQGQVRPKPGAGSFFWASVWMKGPKHFCLLVLPS